MIVLDTVNSLQEHVSARKAEGKVIVLVPTMGALHEGHIALVKAGLARDAHVIVSIFVNPTQFGPSEDLSSYPRTFEADRTKVTAAGGHAIYCPAADQIYPPGFCTTIRLEGPASVGLEDKFRPTHFQGVATVVAKLFAQSRADFATFGEKDYQQLQVVTRLARDLDLGTQIIPVPTLRESDGLALSSRNVYLSAADRATAPTLHSVLQATAEAIRSGRSIASAVLEGSSAIKSAGFALDYLEARHASSLDPVASLSDGPIRLLVAAKIGKTRLIDNIAV